MRHTGWATFNKDYVASGVFEPEGSQLNALREQYEFTQRMLAEHQPDWFAIENYAFSMHSINTTKLAEIGGVVRLAALQAGYQPGKNMLIITPSAVKRFACGKGNAEKDLVMKGAYKRFQFDSDNNNVVDAFIIGKIASYAADVLEGKETPMNKEDASVVEKVVQAHRDAYGAEEDD